MQSLEISFCLLLVTAALGSTELMKTVSFIISLPLHISRGSDTSRDMGLEILPGADVAVNGVNEDSTILSNYTLQQIFLDSGRDKVEILQQFVDLLFHQPHHNVVGITRFLSPRIISILLPLVQKQVQLTVPNEFFVPGNSGSHLTSSLPSTMVKALLTFMHRMEWKTIWTHYQQQRHILFRCSRNAFSNGKVNWQFLNTLNSFTPNQVLLNSPTTTQKYLLDLHKAVQLMCVIHSHQLMWPEYVWIFHSHRMEDFLYHPSACKIENAISRIIIIVSQPELYNPRKLGVMPFKHYQEYTSRLSMVADRYNVSLRPNTLAAVLHDLVWSMISMLKHQGP